MEAKESLERDWSSLLPELLNLIVRNLTEISDFVRFRAVCMAWRSSTTITDLLPQFPWILECHNFLKDDLRFYSIHFGKTYSIHAAKSLGKWLIGLSINYIKIFDITRQVLSLLNLLKDHEIPIPAYDCDKYPNWKGPWQNQMGVQMLCYGPAGCRNPKLVFYHLDQNNWSELIIGSDYVNCDITNCNLFYLDGMLFIVLRDTGVTKVMDVSTNTPAYIIPPVEGYSTKGTEYIMAASGDILRVFQYCDPSADLRQYCFIIHRLHINESGSVCWVEVDNIGNHALFIDMNDGFVLRACDFAGIKRNCIYNLTKMRMGIWEAASCSVERIDIETGAREQFPYPLKKPRGWFVPVL
ncbi:F-box domain-containing protein [Rhynchospora pubera]|uniref:F-box domain-containing protein n=1 Tax=Rhynchospora pubera TaxID=906938 RepID=A0AAV8F505_9POAL|nr:F-box domain-containing protein [Rhynchospora pubera]